MWQTTIVYHGVMAMQSAGAATVPPDYSERIRRLRATLGLTQAQLADRMGVSFASVNRWENGQTRPAALAWQQVVRAEALGIDALGQPGITGTTAPAPAVARPSPTAQTIDFAADPEVVGVVAEGERLAHGYLF